MNKSIATCIIIVVAGILIVVALVHPEYISDKNSFMKEFVGANLLNVLGVILAISLASAAQLHLEFNKVEEHYKRTGMDGSRREVRGAAGGLIILFSLSTVLLVLKPIVTSADLGQALFNGAQLWILLLNVLLLVDLISAAFAIKAQV